MSKETTINADELDAWITTVFDDNAKRKKMHLKNNTEEVYVFNTVKTTRVLILTDEDLPERYKKIPIEQLNHFDFKRDKISLYAIQQAHVVIYVSERLNDFVFIKNRFETNGFDNVVIVER